MSLNNFANAPRAAVYIVVFCKPKIRVWGVPWCCQVLPSFAFRKGSWLHGGVMRVGWNRIPCASGSNYHLSSTLSLADQNHCGALLCQGKGLPWEALGHAPCSAWSHPE